MKIKRQHIVNFIFLAGLIGAFIYFQKWTDKFEKRLLQDGKLAIGTFKGFGYAYRAGGANYKFSYYNENEGRIRNKTDQTRMPKLEQRKMMFDGDQFLVLYNEDGDNIYFDLPIKDSTDFKRYIQEFEAKREKN